MKTTEPMAAKAEEFLLKITQKTNKKEIFFISLNKKKRSQRKLIGKNENGYHILLEIQQSGEKNKQRRGKSINGLQLNFFRDPVSMAEKIQNILV